MAFGGATTGGVRSDINITPLVDVVLVLLIIFMVATPMLIKDLDLTVPEKAETTIATPTTANQIVVSVTKEGQVQINREPIAESQLTEKIHDLLASRSQKLVFFDIDDDAIYGDAIHVMDVARGAGAKTLGIMTKQ
jgi:biopolymer transport protein ExbD